MLYCLLSRVSAGWGHLLESKGCCNSLLCGGKSRREVHRMYVGLLCKRWSVQACFYSVCLIWSSKRKVYFMWGWASPTRWLVYFPGPIWCQMCMVWKCILHPMPEWFLYAELHLPPNRWQLCLFQPGSQPVWGVCEWFDPLWFGLYLINIMLNYLSYLLYLMINLYGMLYLFLCVRWKLCKIELNIICLM